MFIGSCSEANFKLSEESKLPKWFVLPPETSRHDVSITMDYYISSDGREAVFKLFDKNGLRIKKVTGKLTGLAPIKTVDTERDRPTYEIITVNGKTEVIAHKAKNNIFYIVERLKKIEEIKKAAKAQHEKSRGQTP
ncbi:MAG: hypothetical protein GY814_12945 [Gammaproteobacteria bacterium]|nr:hypothetical protein [Gammaproteobacteria bacterium]